MVNQGMAPPVKDYFFNFLRRTKQHKNCVFLIADTSENYHTKAKTLPKKVTSTELGRGLSQAVHFNAPNHLQT